MKLKYKARRLDQNVKASMGSSNSSNKLRAEVDSQRNSTKGTGKGGNSPDFVVTQKGDVIPIPKGLLDLILWLILKEM